MELSEMLAMDDEGLTNLLREELTNSSKDKISDNLQKLMAPEAEDRIKPIVQKIVNEKVEDFKARMNRPQPTIVRATPKIGRNDQCTCGSGKKNKKCCNVS